ncbi:SU10 major capsid protein [Campylobacter pinnipediorum]|nr:DUF5309 family protein [Campylobacter pinnipediorum]
MKQGLVTTQEAFGKSGADLERRIYQIGWTETPFLSTIQTMAPADRSSSVSLGHQWFYDEIPDCDIDNAHNEGAAMADLKNYTGGSLKNHFQIVKNAYGVTGSEAAGNRIDGKKQLAVQGELSSHVHKRTIEKILVSDQAAVQRVNSANTAGKCGGLKSFLTSSNKVDAGGSELSWQMILDLLKVGFLKGRPYKILMMGDNQKDRLDFLLEKKQQATMDTNYLGVNVQTLKSTSYGSNIKILLNPYLENNEIIAYNPEDIVKVNWRPMEVKSRVTTDDKELKEIISEFTLRVCTPYAFCALQSLKAN